MPKGRQKHGQAVQIACGRFQELQELRRQAAEAAKAKGSKGARGRKPNPPVNLTEAGQTDLTALGLEHPTTTVVESFTDPDPAEVLTGQQGIRALAQDVLFLTIAQLASMPEPTVSDLLRLMAEARAVGQPLKGCYGQKGQARSGWFRRFLQELAAVAPMPCRIEATASGQLLISEPIQA